MSKHQAKGLKQYSLSALKWLWMIIVLLGFAFYINQNFNNIVAQLQLVSISSLILSILLLTLGRLSITLMTSQVLQSLGSTFSFKKLFYIVSTSELAKYLPGGIWHFVGRAGYYQSLGMPVSKTSVAILKENLWLVVSAGMASASLLVLGYTGLRYWWVLILFALIWICIIYLWGREVAPQRIVAIVLVQLSIWILNGLSFSILLNISNAPDAIIIIAAFTLSWLIGFLSLFAPGGIGVREVVLVALLLPLFSSTDISIFAITHRILWIIVELLMALFAWVFFNLDS